MNQKRSKDMSEKRILHPAVKKYLFRLGYDYKYEISASQYGICDFVVETRHTYFAVVECKMHLSWHAVGQLLGYKLQFQADEAWLIIPKTENKTKGEEHIFALCQEYGIIVIEIDLLIALDIDKEWIAGEEDKGWITRGSLHYGAIGKHKPRS